MNQKFPCSICPKNVAKNHNAVCCDICNLWVLNDKSKTNHTRKPSDFS